ncbi:unnamed protein product, partial [Echinostoma caproni]|uniref:Zf-LYAR domain-containing protein n=1 Tax=Echinostoma caproni TaxID=27848 RepID=A0A183B9R3_9TREM
TRAISCSSFGQRCTSRYLCSLCYLSFARESYKTHSACLTEAQKYGKSHNGMKRPGPSKQEQWTQTVREVINNCDVKDPQIHSLLRELESCPNLPRKKPKFEVGRCL